MKTKTKKSNAWLESECSWVWEDKANADWIIKCLQITKKNKVLDIGCGTGAHLEDINTKTGADCYGVDLRKDLFVKNKNITLVYSDMEALQFKPSEFDRIFSLGTLEHTPRTSNAFREVSRVLKKDGLALITVPNKISFFHITKKIKQLLGIWKIGYERSFTPHTLISLLREQGLEVQKFWIIPHPRVSNAFNFMDNILNRINKHHFGFFINIVVKKI